MLCNRLNGKYWVKLLKYLGVCFGIFIVFFMGYSISSAVSLIQSMSNPRVNSDYSIRYRIQYSLGAVRLPSSATQLYYAEFGMQDPSYFVAFNIGQAEFEKIIQKHIGVTMDSFKQETSWPNSIIEHGPISWEEEHFDMNWYLDRGTEMLVYEERRKTIVYVPSKNRVFICLWSGVRFAE